MISVISEADTPVLLFEGRLDGITVANAEPVVMSAIAQEGGTVLDLSNLTYISSMGLRLILMAAKRAKQSNKRMALCGLQPQVKEVFQLCGFDKLLNLCETKIDALRFVRA